MASRKKSSSHRSGTRSVRSRRAAPSGRRTLVNLALPQEVGDDLDTLLWLRVTGAGKSVEAMRGGKHQLYDEAVERFLRDFERRECEALPVRQPTQGWRTLWISTPLVERCKQVAKRDGVSVGRVVGYALCSFVEEMMQPAWRAFRKEASDRAGTLLAAKR